MKKMVFAAVAAVAVLAGCATMRNSFIDDVITVFLPDGAIQWSANLGTYAANYARQNSNTDGGAQYDRLYEEYNEAGRESISQAAWSSKEELEQLGKQVFQNPDADVNPVYKRLEERLRTLPPGARLVYGGTAPNEHDVAVVAFLSDDGAFEHYVVED
jgi:hypothetical protein